MIKKRWVIRAVTGLAVVAVLAWFAYGNWDQAVDIRLGLFTLRGVSLSVALYGAVIAGMLLMLIAGWLADTRRKTGNSARESLTSGDTTRGRKAADSRVPEGAEHRGG